MSAIAQLRKSNFCTAMFVLETQGHQSSKKKSDSRLKVSLVKGCQTGFHFHENNPCD